MMRTIDLLRVEEVHFRSLTEQFDSDTAHGRFALKMQGAMAEYFLDLNRERTMDGLKAALARGRRGGRLTKLSEADIEVGRAMLHSGTILIAAIADTLGSVEIPSTATFLRHAFAARLPRRMRHVRPAAHPARAPLVLPHRLASVLRCDPLRAGQRPV